MAGRRPDAIKVAIDASGTLLTEARRNPAKVIAFGAAAAIVFVSAGVGYAAYLGGKFLSDKLLKRSE